MSFTSFGCNSVSFNGGISNFKIQGQVYHKMGSLLPVNHEPAFGQLFFFDSETSINRRSQMNGGLDTLLLNQINRYMVVHNPILSQFKRIIENEPSNVNIVLKEGEKNYAAPTGAEIAILLPNQPYSCRDIVIKKQSDDLQRINELNQFYDPLQYVLLFPHGSKGFHLGIEMSDIGSRQSRTKITPMDYYRYRLAIRGAKSMLHLGGRLFQQYIVDQYAKVENQRLKYIRNNQNQLRVESYRGLMDMFNAGDTDLATIGRRTILPSTFIGSPRHMQQLYQDSMAIVRTQGKPDFLVTFTCNPKWPEITECLLPNQTANDRPDIVVRVFKTKLDCLLKVIKNEGFFGTVQGIIHVVEFQKRGLPHAHILIILKSEDKPRTTDDINRFVSAEIPNPNIDPELYQIVTTSMLHGPCDTRCLKDGKCSKKFPKKPNHTTHWADDGYPMYRRRCRYSFTRNGYTYNDTHVVPYNPSLSKMFAAHINVEIVTGVAMVKYLYKYVYKGHDKASFELEQLDEIQNFVESRYVSSSEACWRLFGYELHREYPSVERLGIHLEDQQMITYTEDGNVNQLLQNSTSTLIAWFNLNLLDETARGYTYTDIPKYFTWDKKNKVWKKRQRNIGTKIGRMYFIAPTCGEKYYLRMLLQHQKGCTSFESVRTHNGITYGTYRETAEAMGLLESDEEWKQCLREASQYQMPKQLRDLFSTILLFNHPSNPGILFQEFEESLLDVNQTVYGALKDIQNYLEYHGSNLETFPELLDLLEQTQPDNSARDDFDIAPNEIDNVELNPEQSLIYEQITRSVYNHSGQLFFVDGPGGTGKTFLINHIISTLSRNGKKVIPVASSGIAALLLKNGRTAHSKFKIPLELDNASICNISFRSDLGKELRNCDLIIWDEAPMMHKYCFEALCRTLQDLCKNELPFGGKTVMFTGDFRQILPVIPKGSRGIIVQSSIKHSNFWHLVQHLKLTMNMRVDQEETEFSNWILNVGNGGQCALHESMLDGIHEVEQLIDKVFGTDNCNSAILAPTNRSVDFINDIVLDKMEEEEVIFPSCDFLAEDTFNNTLYPVEVLNQISCSGLPNHILRLKRNCIVILLRNMDIRNGLCNGTRLRVLSWTNRVLKAQIMYGDHQGKVVFIPRISMVPSDATLPFKLKRVQFPVKLAYAITINKSQGQTLDRVGLYLKQDVFTHGQLYVALSRVKRRSHIYALGKEGTSQVKNVVYKEVLN